MSTKLIPSFKQYIGELPAAYVPPPEEVKSDETPTPVEAPVENTEQK